MTSTHAANLRRMTQPWRGASRPWNDGSRRITDGSLLCQMKFRPPAPSARHQDGKADVVDQIARDAAQQDVTHPRMGEGADGEKIRPRSEEHTSELQSLMRNSYAVFCLKKTKKT